MCALTSVALGPLYINLPVDDSYENAPSPPESIARKCDLTSVALGPVYVKTPVELL